jgi:signal transduction histidine kinase
MAQAATNSALGRPSWRLPWTWGSLVLLLLPTATTLIVAASLAMAAWDHELRNVVPAFGILGFSLFGSIVAIKRPSTPIAWLLVVVGFSLAVLMGSLEYAHHALDVKPGSLPGGSAAAWVSSWCPLITNGLLIGVLPQLYPDGRLISRRWRFALWAAFGFIVLATLGNAFSGEAVEGLTNQPDSVVISSFGPLPALFIAASVPFGIIAVAGGLAGLVVRWRRAQGDERQQIKWFAAGIAPVAVSALFVHALNATIGDVFMAFTLPLVPLCIGVAVLRYRLYDLDLFVNRALVYTILSSAVVALYFALVLAAEQLIGGGRSLPLQAGATVIAAAAFHSLRTQAQRLVDWLFYGDRSRPYEVLARLGERLELAPVPETVPATIVDTIANALRLPGVSIDSYEGAAWVTIARHGTLGPRPAEFPMVYQGEVIGRLVVEHRSPHEAFSGADVRLLADLARQAGVAAHAVRVTTDLQRSRAALVTAREEERRRLRRDLHDGLGPTLAGVTLGLHAARTTINRGRDGADELLASLEAQVEDAVRDIRRLVYGMRPPALDEMGLVRALQQQAQRLESGSGELSLTITATPPQLAELPAAVEVAAYRIATEAMLNTARHSRATTCHVALTVNRSLELSITDDGRGLDADARTGVGMASMRERAAELGGSVDVQSSPAGTVVRAILPLDPIHG